MDVLRDMRPGLPIANPNDDHMGYAKVLSDVRYLPTVSESGAYGANVLVAEFVSLGRLASRNFVWAKMRPMSLTACRCAEELPILRLPAFSNVSHVLGVGSEVEMAVLSVIADTQFVVAGMENPHPFRNRAVRKLPCKTVRPMGLSIHPELRITGISPDRAVPHPTRVGLRDAVPEISLGVPGFAGQRQSSTSYSLFYHTYQYRHNDIVDVVAA